MIFHPIPSVQNSSKSFKLYPNMCCCKRKFNYLQKNSSLMYPRLIHSSLWFIVWRNQYFPVKLVIYVWGNVARWIEIRPSVAWIQEQPYFKNHKRIKFLLDFYCELKDFCQHEKTWNPINRWKSGRRITLFYQSELTSQSSNKMFSITNIILLHSNHSK